MIEQEIDYEGMMQLSGDFWDHWVIRWLMQILKMEDQTMFKMKSVEYSATLRQGVNVSLQFETWEQGFYVYVLFSEKKYSLQIYDSDYPELKMEMRALCRGEVRGVTGEEFAWKVWYEIFLKNTPSIINGHNGSKINNPLEKCCPAYWEEIKKYGKK